MKGENMRVRKAVIPAAGLGTRFLPATKALPKEMIPIVDKPAIQYIVEEIVASGIEDILIITGRGKRAIEDHFDKSFELNQVLKERERTAMLETLENIEKMADIHYLRQKEALGTGHAILKAKYHIGNEPFAVLFGDDLVVSEEPCLAQLMKLYDKYSASILAVQRVPLQEVSEYGVVKGKPINEVHLVEDLVEKPKPEEAPSNLALLGRYILVAISISSFTLSWEITATPTFSPFNLSIVSKILSPASFCNPWKGSSSSKYFGSESKALPKTVICLSPPLIVDAFCLLNFLRTGKSS